jgi:dienelactone hydrolase
MTALRRLLALCVTLAAGAAAAQERVSFPSRDGATIGAVLVRPAGAGPFPAVVALHGCGGRDTRRGELQARHRDWAERWAAQGFLVLLPESFGSRGLGSQCGEARRSVTPRRERAGDADAARRYLLTRPDVRPGAINLVGWSNGGSTVLWTLDGAAPRGEPDFARAVAFYPGCRGPARNGARARLPLLILIGEADDWTAPGPCRDYAQGAGGRVELVVYPGAVHGFDAPASGLRRREGLGITATGSGSAMVGTDPEARADAIRRVSAFLAR